MGYCTVNDFKATIAQTLSTASPNPATLQRPAKLADLGKQLNLTSSTGSSVGTYSLTDVNYYIRQASSIVDAALKQQYVVPLHPVAMMAMRLTADVDEYTGDTITVTRTANLIVGDSLVITQSGVEETVEVEAITDGVITLVNAVANDFNYTKARVLLVKFPDPIPYVTAKLACAMFYDKYAKAQQEPGKSEYGDILRKEATAELNNIREGRTILEADRDGSRFVNPNLYARHALGKIIDSDGTRSDQGRG